MTNTAIVLQPTPTQAGPYDLSAIDFADLGLNTKTKYRHEVEKYLDTGAKLTDYDAVKAYARELGTSGRAFFRAAIRLLNKDVAERLDANVRPDTWVEYQAAKDRMKSIEQSIHVSKPKGTKFHTWLSAEQVTKITALCGPDLEGQRDWIILSLLLGAGLRRDELVSLTFAALKQRPAKGGGMRDMLSVKGKGAKDRIIPISSDLAERIREWQRITGSTNGDKIARALGRAQVRTLTKSMSSVGVFNVVRKYGTLIGIPTLAPHDMRRTFAELRRAAGEPITRISNLLGHANSGVTERYLNLKLDLDNVLLDVIPLTMWKGA